MTDNIAKPQPTKVKPLLALGQIVALNYGKRKPSEGSKKKLKNSEIKRTRLLNRQLIIDPTFGEDKNISFAVNVNSIQQVVDECHPDIRKFFNFSNVLRYVASAGHLLIDLNNGLSISITSLRGNQKKYRITNKEGTELLVVSG